MTDTPDDVRRAHATLGRERLATDEALMRAFGLLGLDVDREQTLAILRRHNHGKAGDALRQLSLAEFGKAARALRELQAEEELEAAKPNLQERKRHTNTNKYDILL